jgi:hypothetical protein
MTLSYKKKEEEKKNFNSSSDAKTNDSDRSDVCMCVFLHASNNRCFIRIDLCVCIRIVSLRDQVHKRKISSVIFQYYVEWL